MPHHPLSNIFPYDRAKIFLNTLTKANVKMSITKFWFSAYPCVAKGETNSLHKHQSSLYEI